MSELGEYQNKFEFMRLERDEGVLLVTLHNNEMPFQITGRALRDFADAWDLISRDMENRVVILTGTGDSYCDGIDFESFADVGNLTTALGWYQLTNLIVSRHMRNMASLELPVIAAVNGPNRVHPELSLLCDMVLATETAEFADRSHFPDFVPGDANQYILQELLGSIRAKHLLFTAGSISAADAKSLGLVNEILTPEELLPRAWELARAIAKSHPLTIRHTKNVLNRRLRRIIEEESAYSLAVEGIAAFGSLKADESS